MTNNTIIIVLFLMLAAIVTHYGYGEDYKQVELKLSADNKPFELRMSVYPETVAIGDSCYVLVTAVNNTNEDIRVMDTSLKPLCSFTDSFVTQFSLSRHSTWHGAFECWHATTAHTQPKFMTIPGGKTMPFVAMRLQFPPLEDLYQDDFFWGTTLKELKDHPEGLPFGFGIGCPALQINNGFLPGASGLALEVTIKLRNEEEMAMIEQWYHDTPKEFFPEIYQQASRGNSIIKIPGEGIFRQRRRGELLNVDDRLWHCMALGNRYPGEPNIPKTWQGWKELEERITPSTMRDEIRLTRILFQYCETEDKEVLNELKEWFAGMNEVQRTCMAKSIRDRFTFSTWPLFGDLYKAIHEHDVTAKTDQEIESLKQLELLE